jgi:Flp pilus assembly protein TadD
MPGGANAAASAYNRSLQLDPVFVRSIRGLATLLANAGQVDDAFGLLEQALAHAPDDPDLLHARGMILFDVGRFAEAEKDYRDGLKRDPRNVILWVELGSALDMQKKYPEAEAAYHQALALARGATRPTSI